MRIIDVHAHLGFDYVLDHDFPLAALVDELENMGADVLIVQPGTTVDIQTAREQHDAIAEFARTYPGRVYGMANPSPHLPEGVYRAELWRCVRELGFVGVKLHTLAHSVGVHLRSGRLVFQVAQELGIPVMIHTGIGVPFALPSAAIPAAQEFDDVKVVLAHSGGQMFSREALLAATLCQNVYLEASWLPGGHVRGFCQAIGANRVLLGADHASNLATELTKFRTAGLTDAELEYCLGQTAAEVYRLP